MENNLSREDEIINKIARRTAEEQDRIARQRMDEYYNPHKYRTPEQQRAWLIAAAIALIIGILIIVLPFMTIGH